MWNILIVLIIAIVIWMINPLSHSAMKPASGVDKKTQNEVNQVVNDVQKQVDYAQQIQNEQQQNLNN